jgi:hypothetical protein
MAKPKAPKMKKGKPPAAMMKQTKKGGKGKGGMKEFGAMNAAKKGAVVKAKRGGPKAAKKKIVKKK